MQTRLPSPRRSERQPTHCCRVCLLSNKRGACHNVDPLPPRGVPGLQEWAARERPPPPALPRMPWAAPSLWLGREHRSCCVVLSRRVRSQVRFAIPQASAAPIPPAQNTENGQRAASGARVWGLARALATRQRPRSLQSCKSAVHPLTDDKRAGSASCGSTGARRECHVRSVPAGRTCLGPDGVAISRGPRR